MRRAEPPSPGLGPQLRDFDSTFSAWQAIAKEWPSLFKPKADEVPRLPHPMNVHGGYDGK